MKLRCQTNFCSKPVPGNRKIKKHNGYYSRPKCPCDVFVFIRIPKCNLTIPLTKTNHNMKSNIRIIMTNTSLVIIEKRVKSKAR